MIPPNHRVIDVVRNDDLSRLERYRVVIADRTTGKQRAIFMNENPEAKPDFVATISHEPVRSKIARPNTIPDEIANHRLNAVYESLGISPTTAPDMHILFYQAGVSSEKFLRTDLKMVGLHTLIRKMSRDGLIDVVGYGVYSLTKLGRDVAAQMNISPGNQVADPLQKAYADRGFRPPTNPDVHKHIIAALAKRDIIRVTDVKPLTSVVYRNFMKVLRGNGIADKLGPGVYRITPEGRTLAKEIGIDKSFAHS